MAQEDLDPDSTFSLHHPFSTRTRRIRIAEHPLQVHLLLAVGTGLLLSHDAPASDTELVEPEHQRSREVT